MRDFCPFGPDYIVTWVPEAPANWHWLYTGKPMKIIGARWHDGIPSEYAEKFGEDGMRIKPDWILLVEFEADDSQHYDPPLSLLLCDRVIRKEVHEMWLVPVK